MSTVRYALNHIYIYVYIFTHTHIRNPCPCLEVNSGRPADAVNAEISKMIEDQWLYFAFDRRAGIITGGTAPSNLVC